MPLVWVPFDIGIVRPTPAIRRFLRVADRRIERFRSHFRVPAFISSDFNLAYAALCQLEASGLATGDSFCEWGSGLGVISCLASLAGFQAQGFEVQGRLVQAARRLAADFDLSAEFTRGSFIPSAAKKKLLANREFAWLNTDARCGYETSGMSLEDFDVIYAYPWPDEECLVEQLFEGHARFGALLMTYHEEHGLWLRRKIPSF